MGWKGGRLHGPMGGMVDLGVPDLLDPQPQLLCQPAGMAERWAPSAVLPTPDGELVDDDALGDGNDREGQGVLLDQLLATLPDPVHRIRVYPRKAGSTKFLRYEPNC